MAAGAFVGRVGGIAVALGVGVAVAHGGAVAAADTGPQDSASAGAGRSSSAPAPKRAVRSAAARTASAPQSRLGSGPQRPGPAAAGSAVRSAAEDAMPAALATLPARSSASARTATVAAPAAAAPAATAAPAAAGTVSVLAPSPDATVVTQYGDLGKWMINKNGDVADWVGLPYCTGDVCKTLQEPINTIFTVEARSKFMAEARLNRTLRKAGFPPSCCSSVGYKAIVDELTSQQMPRGGILGIGVLGPGFIQRGLLGLLAGIGPAYRDASFLVANSHLRTFGGVPDGNGNYVFTASVSKEYLTKDPATGRTTHGYDSFDEARAKLLSDMVAIGATNMGLVEMDNKIPAIDPDYSTGDHDGKAQVIAIGLMAGMAWRAPNPG